MKKKVNPISFSTNIKDFKKFELDNKNIVIGKAYICYDSKNRNQTNIDKEVIEEKLLPTLYYTPVVGNWIATAENNDGSVGNFGGHDFEIVQEGGKYIIKSLTQPYGVVPDKELANPKWEEIIEDGEAKNYLTCNVLLFYEKYQEEVDFIINNEVNQSMELNIDSYEVTDEGYFDIKDGSFSALCILGRDRDEDGVKFDSDIEPCFPNAKITTQFSFNIEDFKSEYLNLIQEFKEFTKDALLNEGGEEVVNKTKNKVEEKSSFSATHNQKRDALNNVLDSTIIRNDQEEVIEETYFYISDFDDKYVYVSRSHYTSDDYNRDYGRFTYSFDEKNITATLTGEFESMYLLWFTKDKKNQVEKDRSDYSLLKEKYNNLESENNLLVSENEILKKYKQTKEQEELNRKLEKEKQEKIDYINNEYPSLPEEIKNQFIENIDNYKNIDDLDSDICVYIVKNKVDFSNKKKDSSIKVKINNEEKIESGYYGKYSPIK